MTLSPLPSEDVFIPYIPKSKRLISINISGRCYLTFVTANGTETQNSPVNCPGEEVTQMGESRTLSTATLISCGRGEMGGIIWHCGKNQVPPRWKGLSTWMIAV